MATTLKTKSDVLDFLKSKNVGFKEYTHKPAMTIDDLRADPAKLEHAPFIKNLVYVDKKKLVHFVVSHEATQVSKGFWKSVGTSHNNMRMATEAQLLETLHTYKGAVNVFALLNDKQGTVAKVYFDKKLESLEYLSFHPQENTSTLEVKREDVLKLLAEANKTPTFHDLEISEEAAQAKPEAAAKDAKAATTNAPADDGDTKLKIEFKKEDAFGSWYTQVISKADMVDYYDVSGCYILKPNAYFVWEKIQGFLDTEFKRHAVKNVYFPMFVTKKNLEREKEHVEGFSAEVAWVTHYGKSQLAEPIAIRPTSETIMYPSFAKWIHSHRDLPLLLNQWTNVVRWEFKHPTPFIRTREFLWQEGHTAHATKEESDKFVRAILDVYKHCYQELLAVPVVQGMKSQNEKFAGADYTTTCETFIAENGRAVQACTSHNLGQNFAKMFEIEYEDAEMKKHFAYQTSWGFTTRSIGLVIMIHGDDKGVVFPPKVAPIQAVIVPVFYKDKDNQGIDKRCQEMLQTLRQAGIRAEYDDRPNYSTGWKYNDWEMKGVTIRLEVGPKDFANNEARLVRRVDGHKEQIALTDIVTAVNHQMGLAHQIMFTNAEKKLKNSIVVAETWNDFMHNLNSLKIVKTPWCEVPECEDKVKERSGIESKMVKNEESTMSGSAKTLCLPFEQEKLKEGALCFHCQKPASKYVLWGRSY